MRALMEVFSVIMAICVIAYYVRPVTLFEKTCLLALAEGDEDCQELADSMVDRKWLTVAAYEQTERVIAGIKSRRRRDQKVAESFASKATRDARRKS